ncbi:unnamed protein product [Rhizoctonia solani]|uniref:Protein kinase domain-containing protein n=1 Tax=Rhizoctonia solani TaxID=456999 RepID=A0A8H3GC46_9AGAM|nr:unnamed protein product [Rhizoctonia solani]
MVVLRNIISGIYPARPEVYLPVTNSQADATWSLLLDCWALDPLARPRAFHVCHQMYQIALARPPISALPSENRSLVLNSSSYYDLGIPRMHTPNFLYVPYAASALIGLPLGNHSSTGYESLQNYEGVFIQFISKWPVQFQKSSGATQAKLEKRVVDAPAAIIHNEMTIGEVLKHLADHGCNDVTRELGDCQSEYPVSIGGYGDVYCGTLNNGKEVGLKCVRLLLDSSDKGQKKLKNTARELYVWSKCDHPNVMKLIGVAQFRNQLAMVSAWMDNGNMREFLRRHPQTNRHLLCTQIIDGVIYLHNEKSIAHGDLKGANILISCDQIPKITDFGNSTLKECSLRFSVTDSGPAFSVRWTAPEILEEKTGITVEGDIYALGMTILEVITGEVPYHGVRDVALCLKIIKSEYPKRPERHISSQNERGNLLWSLLMDCWAYEPHLRPTATSIQDKMKRIAGESESSSIDTLH